MSVKAFLLLSLLSSSVFAAPVKITFTRTAGQVGMIYYAVFDRASQFPKGTPVASGSVSTAKSVATLDLEPGTYAISAFLDRNGNGQLDTNRLGIPTERFGFSNNPRILTGSPSFNSAAVRVLDQSNDIMIRLITITDQ
jgi:uncharacterized protein (DUF2141 family)